MEKAASTDFIVDSHGNCFFCFQRNIPPVPVSYESLPRRNYLHNTSLYSLHYLYRYLGMDIREMVNLEMTNSSQLHFNRKVPRSLKVYLCEECSNENALFGKLYQQLEKIQMELISSLETIHMKLASGDDARENSLPVHQLGLTNVLNDKLELVQTMRTKITEKCYSKLKHELPRITVKKLSAKVLRTSLTNKNCTALKNDRDLRPGRSNRHTDESDPAEAVKMEYVKVENPTSQDEMSDESGNSDWLDNGTHSTSEGGDSANEIGYAVIKPANLNPQEMNMKRKFICNICKRGFGRNQNLRRHHRTTSCGKGLAPTPVKHSCHCRICGKGFTRSLNLRRHHITAHLQLNRFECNFCGMKFKRSDVLKCHVLNIHQKWKIKDT